MHILFKQKIWGMLPRKRKASQKTMEKQKGTVLIGHMSLTQLPVVLRVLVTLLNGDLSGTMPRYSEGSLEYHKGIHN